MKINKSPIVKQITIILAVALLVGFLFSREVKGLVQPAEKNQNTGAKVASNSLMNISLKRVSDEAKDLIDKSIAQKISILEQKYTTASGEDKTRIAKVLAEQWTQAGQDGPSGFYCEEIAKKQSDITNWLITGDRFLDAFDNSKDSVMQMAFLQKANIAYNKALKFESQNIPAQIGVATTIVNGLGAPMQGIRMLLEVIKKEPKNIKANMNLGIFAIKSGQFDKAIMRFNNVIAIKETPEAYFYLATAYENLGNKVKAIEAYTKSKKITNNLAFSKFIDKKLVELQRNK